MTKKIKKYIILVAILFITLVAGYFFKIAYTQYNLKQITQIQLQQKQYISNKKTLNYLKQINNLKIEIDSDNQGSGNTLYYVEKINGNYFDVTYIKIKNEIRLKSIYIRK